jgi:hypothetical protein
MKLNKKSPICPKCLSEMILEYSPKHQRFFYYCPNKNCDIAISAHPNLKPVGIPANRTTRELRQYTHKLANHIWNYKDPVKRNKMYKWLEKHSISKHIGKMGTKELGEIIEKFKLIISKYNL